MRALPFLLGLIAAAASAVPAVWMAILAVVQFGNLWMQPPYVREFPAIACFWLGFVAAVVFFAVCLKGTLRHALSPWLLVPIGVGLVGGIVEEVMLRGIAKASFPIGFFEIAPLSWIIAGVITTKLPNPADRPTSAGG